MPTKDYLKSSFVEKKKKKTNQETETRKKRKGEKNPKKNEVPLCFHPNF